MDQLLQEFETPVVDSTGFIYRVFLYGRSRPHDTWQGWLVFERVVDGKRFSTDVETTQPSAEAILYWATGLTDAYFDGAFDRALNPQRHDMRAIPSAVPVTGRDSHERRRRLGALERAVLHCFHQHGTMRLRSQAIFDDLAYSHADIVRAFEDLEKQGGLLVRQTDQGNDWIVLTDAGLVAAGLIDLPHVHEQADREPPRNF